MTGVSLSDIFSTLYHGNIEINSEGVNITKDNDKIVLNNKGIFLNIKSNIIVMDNDGIKIDGKSYKPKGEIKEEIISVGKCKYYNRYNNGILEYSKAENCKNTYEEYVKSQLRIESDKWV